MFECVRTLSTYFGSVCCDFMVLDKVAYSDEVLSGLKCETQEHHDFLRAFVVTDYLPGRNRRSNRCSSTRSILNTCWLRMNSIHAVRLCASGHESDGPLLASLQFNQVVKDQVANEADEWRTQSQVAVISNSSIAFVSPDLPNVWKRAQVVIT